MRIGDVIARTTADSYEAFLEASLDISHTGNRLTGTD